MSLETRLTALAQAVGADVKALYARAPANELQQALVATYVNGTVTPTDIFTGFTPLANKRYWIESFLTSQSASTGNGIQVALLGPTTGITRAAIKLINPNLATSDRIAHISALGTYGVATSGLTTPSLVMLEAIVEVGATPGAGNLRLSARASAAAANAVQIFPGAFMRWREI